MKPDGSDHLPQKHRAPPPENESTLAGTPPAARLPARIGDFRILRLLGAGGMGVVYEAEQQHPKRAVALKVVRGGSYVDETHLRMFRREVQTLARLKHSGIAAIYESGHTDDGQHFFAMELVRGETLGEYCKRRAPEGRLSPAEVKERLALFRKICDAVNYAHQRGVIHRDLKPGNILVLRDATGSSSLATASDIKILDFGLARITDSDVAVSTVLTDLGSVQGTIPYMSPEQVRGNSDEIDLRTDVYSLGVVLYEMLAGQLPLDVQRVQLPEAVRIICEEPPKSLARTWRGTRQVNPDLQTIVHKALEKEPARRYQSTAAFAEDLQRYLTDQPILARPPSVAYQLRKLVVRHKAPVAFVVALFTVLAAFATVMTVQAGRIARERDRANLEAESAKQVSEFLVSLFKVSDPSEARGNTITAREILNRASTRIAHELQDQPLLQARLMSTIGNVERSLGLTKEAVPLLEEALRIREKILGPNHTEVAQNLYDLAWATGGEERRELFRRSLEIRENALGPHHPDVAYSLWGIGVSSVGKSDYKAEQEALERAQTIFEQDPESNAVGLSWCLNDLGGMAINKGDYAAAQPLLERALNLKEKALGPDHPDVANGLNAVGYNLTLLGDYEAALPYLERSLAIFDRVLAPPGDGPTSLALDSYGELLYRMHRNVEAKRVLERCIAILERGGNNPFPMPLSTLALVLQELGETARAEACYERALALRPTPGADKILDKKLETYAARKFASRHGRESGAPAYP